MVRAVPSISRIACSERLARRHQVVALGGEELEPLGLLGVLLDRQRIDRADALERLDDPPRLVLERLEVEVEHRRLGQQRVERLLPFGLDPLDDRTAAGRRPRSSRAPADGTPRSAARRVRRAGDRRLLRLGQGVLGPQGGRVGLGGRGLQLVHATRRSALASIHWAC